MYYDQDFINLTLKEISRVKQENQAYKDVITAMEDVIDGLREKAETLDGMMYVGGLIYSD